MPLFKDWEYANYEDFIADVRKAYEEAKTKPIFGDLWLEMMIKHCPSVGERMRGTELDPSGMDEIPVYITRAANTYFNMFYGPGWYNQGDPNIYPGSGYKYFLDELKSD
jgi:hypothetical protein